MAVLKASQQQITLGELTLPLAFFQQQESAYALPEGAIGVEYLPDERFTVFYIDRAVGAELPWEKGDLYLSQVEQYRSAWEAANVPTQPSLESVKAKKIASFNQLCQAEILAGFDSEALGASHHYSAELEDQLNLMGSAVLGVDVPYVCTDQAGVKAARLHTAAQMKQVYGDGAIVKGQMIFKFHSLREQVEAATTIEAIHQVDW